jgi:hypothetical protein
MKKPSGRFEHSVLSRYLVPALLLLLLAGLLAVLVLVAAGILGTGPT